MWAQEDGLFDVCSCEAQERDKVEYERTKHEPVRNFESSTT